jgi:hypothetical protein
MVSRKPQDADQRHQQRPEDQHQQDQRQADDEQQVHRQRRVEALRDVDADRRRPG